MTPDIAVGTRVRHRISGFHGVVTARIEYLNGLPQVQVTGSELSEGKVLDFWFAEDAVEAT